MRTENLLQQSQQLTMELQTRQSELQQTNEELASKAKQLAEQNVEVERKNKEVEQARRALEEKAAELALTSKYKSEFLANMSHELRTPLNSILILGQQLAENTVGNLMPKQVDFARNIHSAGTDLLTLINDILDLSKIESGTVTVEAEEITFNALRDSVERNFHHLAEAKNLTFHVDIDNTLPRAFTSDPKRLQQILKNLLSNAFKFTAHGVVAMRVQSVGSGWSPDHPVLRFVPGALAIEVSDTGIGIAPEKQRLIFEAFQQADAGTSRKYEREKAQQALQLANQELERRVHERTVALRDARDEAERQSRLKDEFLATLSHELRTPMNVILGWLDTLTKGKAIRDPRSALTVVQRNAEIQARLIDDLLDMNRLMAGNLQIELVSVDVGGTIRSTIQGLQPAADAKGVELDCVIDARDVGVLADARRLQQVMWNLLHNAIKFTPRGGRVEVRVGQQNGHVTIVVQDNGHGIHREFLPHVFERFRQQDASTTRESPGLGLGLSIAKHLVELHGGRIGAFSDGEGAGAKFVVELPAVK